MPIVVNIATEPPTWLIRASGLWQEIPPIPGLMQPGTNYPNRELPHLYILDIPGASQSQLEQQIEHAIMEDQARRAEALNDLIHPPAAQTPDEPPTWEELNPDLLPPATQTPEPTPSPATPATPTTPPPTPSPEPPPVTLAPISWQQLIATFAALDNIPIPEVTQEGDSIIVTAHLPANMTADDPSLAGYVAFWERLLPLGFQGGLISQHTYRWTKAPPTTTGA